MRSFANIQTAPEWLRGNLSRFHFSSFRATFKTNSDIIITSFLFTYVLGATIWANNYELFLFGIIRSLWGTSISDAPQRQGGKVLRSQDSGIAVLVWLAPKFFSQERRFHWKAFCKTLTPVLVSDSPAHWWQSYRSSLNYFLYLAGSHLRLRNVTRRRQLFLVLSKKRQNYS